MELTKVYVVQAENGERCEDYDCWTEGVFASAESAYKYIDEHEKQYDADIARIRELKKLNDMRAKDGTYDSFEKYGPSLDRIFDSEKKAIKYIENELKDYDYHRDRFGIYEAKIKDYETISLSIEETDVE